MTARRSRPYTETEDYVKFSRRILRALGTRVADADIEMLQGLAELSTLADEMLGDAARTLHDVHGFSWTDIGRALGVSKQAAAKRFNRQPEVVD